MEQSPLHGFQYSLACNYFVKRKSFIHLTPVPATKTSNFLHNMKFMKRKCLQNKCLLFLNTLRSQTEVIRHNLEKFIRPYKSLIRLEIDEGSSTYGLPNEIGTGSNSHASSGIWAQVWSEVNYL